MKNLVTCIILLSFCHSVFSQTEQDSNEKSKGLNSIYAQIGGASVLYGVNYEHGFMLKRIRNKFSVKIGFSNTLLDGFRPAMPLGISFDFGKKKSFFQLNLNRTLNISKEGDNSNFSLGLAYVRRPIKGFYFHASVSYLIYDNEQPNWDGSIKSIILPGIGVGYSF